ncbi:MAG: hypothetical protein NTV29_10935 [Planctomycetota bacterium]|nr:hypothetical protein [Planctomycetota bacterium]
MISKMPIGEMTLRGAFKPDRPIGHRLGNQWRNTTSENPKGSPDDTPDITLRDLICKIL